MAASLRLQIIRGEFAEGDALPTEAALMQRFGVSRPSLREALRILESQHLITIHRGARGGPRAARPVAVVAGRFLGTLMESKGVTLADVLESREWLEPLAVRVLASRDDRAAVVRQLAGLVDDDEALSGDLAGRARVAARFHQQLVQLCGNRTIGLLWEVLDHVLTDEDGWAIAEWTTRGAAARVQACRSLLDLIDAGDAERAEELWRSRLTSLRKRIVVMRGAKRTVKLVGREVVQ